MGILASMNTKTVSQTNNGDENDAITDKEVYTILGLKCRSGHTARRLADDGKIRQFRYGPRTLRYSRSSVLAFRDRTATGAK